MSVRNAGASIREARLKAGLSQEKLSEGICSSLSLSRIENGSAGVSPSTFQALMAHAGAPCEIFPIFANRRDFECFYVLKHVRFYLDSWQLQPAYEELNKIENMNWSDNRLYYQEWLLLHCKLQFRSGLADHPSVHGLLRDALHITRPELDLNDFRSSLLSLNEIELLILLAQECLYLNQCNVSLLICTQIESYLSNSEITYLEKNKLLAENAIVYAKYLISISDYTKAYEIADRHRHQMVLNSNDAPLLELTFLTGLALYHLNNTSDALTAFENAFYSAHSIESCYATVIRNYIKQLAGLVAPAYLLSLPDIELVSYKTKKAIDTSHLTDGTYDIFSPDIFTIGNMIRCFRTEQKVSQTVLCQGLCSKSKLSKIENGTLQPDIFLTEALLQRLGISERAFTFWGNAKEHEIYDIKFKLLKSQHLSKSDYQLLSSKLLNLSDPKDVLNYQLSLYESADLEADSLVRLSVLFKALNCTLPDFDINFIHNYRLSWCELSILNNIAHEYRIHSPEKSNLYFSKILDYFQFSSSDMLLAKTVLSPTLYLYCHSLYAQKRFQQTIDLHTLKIFPILKNSLLHLGAFLCYSSQSFGECLKTDQCKLYGCYAYALENLMELQPNADALKKYLFEDFRVQLNDINYLL